MHKSWIFRDAYLAEWEEYVPANSWSGHRRLFESVDRHLQVNLQVNVYGQKDRGKLRPYCFTAWVGLSTTTVRHQVAGGRCRSLKQVEEYLEGLDLQGAIRNAVRAFYAQENSYRVYRRIQPGAGPEAWTLWGTVWGWLSSWPWPNGEYIAVGWDPVNHTPTATRIVRSAGCTFTQGHNLWETAVRWAVLETYPGTSLPVEAYQAPHPEQRAIFN